MDNNKVLTMIEDEMPSVMKKCEKRYRLSEFWFYEDIHDWVFYGTIDILWHNLMTEYGAFTPGKEFKCAEEALAGLLRRGCNKDNFYFPNIQKILVRMENLSYVINKGPRCFNARPNMPGRYHADYQLQWIAFSTEEFADFIFDFETIVPMVFQKTEEVLEPIKLKWMQSAKIFQVLEPFRKTHLEPVGITIGIRDFDERSARVRFWWLDKVPLDLDVPIDSIQEIFASVPEMMSRQEDSTFRNFFFCDYPADDV